MEPWGLRLRQRLEMAGCYPVNSTGHGGPEAWFSPHLGRIVVLPRRIESPEEADAALHAAGMEPVFARKDTS